MLLTEPWLEKASIGGKQCMALNKFLDPKNDFCFKRLFGTEKYRNMLAHFINNDPKIENKKGFTK